MNLPGFLSEGWRDLITVIGLTMTIISLILSFKPRKKSEFQTEGKSTAAHSKGYNSKFDLPKNPFFEPFREEGPVLSRIWKYDKHGIKTTLKLGFAAWFIAFCLRILPQPMNTETYLFACFVKNAILLIAFFKLCNYLSKSYSTKRYFYIISAIFFGIASLLVYKNHDVLDIPQNAIFNSTFLILDFHSLIFLLVPCIFPGVFYFLGKWYS